jgi:hypothetical protein
MASFNKFEQFVEDVAHKVHDLETDTLKVMLTNSAPSASLDAVLADLTEISVGSGYSAGGSQATQSSSGQTSGTYKLVVGDVTFTASGGSIGPFRYAVIYNDTPTSPADPLIGWWDYGTNVTITDGNSFLVDTSAVNGILQLV